MPGVLSLYTSEEPSFRLFLVPEGLSPGRFSTSCSASFSTEFPSPILVSLLHYYWTVGRPLFILGFGVHSLPALCSAWAFVSRGACFNLARLSLFLFVGFCPACCSVFFHNHFSIGTIFILNLKRLHVWKRSSRSFLHVFWSSSFLEYMYFADPLLSCISLWTVKCVPFMLGFGVYPHFRVMFCKGATPRACFHLACMHACLSLFFFLLFLLCCHNVSC